MAHAFNDHIPKSLPAKTDGREENVILLSTDELVMRRAKRIAASVAREIAPRIAEALRDPRACREPLTMGFARIGFSSGDDVAVTVVVAGHRAKL